MLEKALLEALPLVTTPLSLVAFLASAVMLMHVRTVRRAETLIRTAPAESRPTLVAGALDILDVRAKNLTREQRFELALEILEQRRFKNLLVFWLSLVLALIFAGLAAYSFARPNVQRNVEAILAEKNRETAMPLLNKNGIFEAADESVVEYLAKQASLPSAERAKLSTVEADRAAQLRYESIASVRELRSRAVRREEPFALVGEEVGATIPDRIDHPRQFFVHVPINSRYADRPVKITSLTTNRYIRVFARAAIDPTNTATEVHLSREQATYLEGVFPVTGRVSVTIRETVEDLYDPNCSHTDRPPQVVAGAKELCQQGTSVSMTYVHNFVRR